MGSEWLAIASMAASFIFAYLYTSYRYDDKLHKAFKILFLFLSILCIIFGFSLMFIIASLGSYFVLADSMITFMFVNGILGMLVIILYLIHNMQTTVENITSKRRTAR
tara:strand:+ start:127 stop:450 length:324 start_codon:yes stop_codon:yes gene_type:complete